MGSSYCFQLILLSWAAHTAFSSYCFHGQLILLSAHTAFMGSSYCFQLILLSSNFPRDAPHAFGTCPSPLSNTVASRGGYCIWLGTTHNLAETHRCLNLDTLREITGDIFRPALLTNAAILWLSQLAGDIGTRPSSTDVEIPLENPTPRYALDPTRGLVQVMKWIWQVELQREV